MINFSWISNKTVIGKFLREPFKLIPQNMVLPVLQGPLKGKKWIVGSGNHGCWLGSYEYRKQILFAKTVKEGSIVYDIGAHVGFYTLLASGSVGPRGKVIVFEPLPQNLRYLKQHLHLNRCDNVIIIEAAVAEKTGNAFFEECSSTSEGHLSSKGCLQVKTVGLDDLVTKGEIPPPNYMKIDVEGAESLVLHGARQILSNYFPTIFLATHRFDIHQQCCAFLKEIGYDLQPINEGNIEKVDEIIAYKKKHVTNLKVLKTDE